MNEEKVALFEKVSLKINELNNEINTRISTFKKLKTEKDIIEFISTCCEFSIEKRLSSLEYKDIIEILEKYENYINWKKFSYLYLERISETKRYKRGKLPNENITIINNRNFIISNLSLIKNYPLPELYYILHPNRITEIIFILVSGKLHISLTFYKIYEALVYYFPNEVSFHEKFSHYSNLIKENAIMSIKNCRNYGVFIDISQEFNISKHNIGKYFFLLFLMIKEDRTKSFKELSELISTLKYSRVILSDNILTNFEELIVDNLVNENSIDDFDEYYREMNIENINIGIKKQEESDSD